MPCLGAIQTCSTNRRSYCSVLSDLLIWIPTTVGLWTGGQRHTVGCSGSRSGQQVSFSDDCGQQIKVSVPEVEQWRQGETGCLLSEPPRFSHRHCSISQVTYSCFVTYMCRSQWPSTSILPIFFSKVLFYWRHKFRLDQPFSLPKFEFGGLNIRYCVAKAV